MRTSYKVYSQLIESLEKDTRQQNRQIKKILKESVEDDGNKIAQNLVELGVYEDDPYDGMFEYDGQTIKFNPIQNEFTEDEKEQLKQDLTNAGYTVLKMHNVNGNDQYKEKKNGQPAVQKFYINEIIAQVDPSALTNQGTRTATNIADATASNNVAPTRTRQKRTHVTAPPYPASEVVQDILPQSFWPTDEVYDKVYQSCVVGGHTVRLSTLSTPALFMQYFIACFELGVPDSFYRKPIGDIIQAKNSQLNINSDLAVISSAMLEYGRYKKIIYRSLQFDLQSVYFPSDCYVDNNVPYFDAKQISEMNNLLDSSDISLALKNNRYLYTAVNPLTGECGFANYDDNGSFAFKSPSSYDNIYYKVIVMLKQIPFGFDESQGCFVVKSNLNSKQSSRWSPHSSTSLETYSGQAAIYNPNCYTFAVFKLSNGNWYAIVGNDYNAYSDLHNFESSILTIAKNRIEQ